MQSGRVIRKMHYEVEQKFPAADLPAVAARLTQLGAEVAPPVEEIDLYFAHPARDFAQTDEALRLRQRAGAVLIAYKGPKIDATTKTRREIELPLVAEPKSWAAWIELLEVLGFRRVAQVHKWRRKAVVSWKSRQIEASLDEVERVGTFVELEILAQADGVEAAKTRIASLAESLELGPSERRSYLELLLRAK
jgi:adenylate cyclase, class 2